MCFIKRPLYEGLEEIVTVARTAVRQPPPIKSLILYMHCSSHLRRANLRLEQQLPKREDLCRTSTVACEQASPSHQSVRKSLPHRTPSLHVRQQRDISFDIHNMMISTRFAPFFYPWVASSLDNIYTPHTHTHHAR